MKKILALVFFLMVAAACTKEPATNTGMASNTNSMMATKSATPSAADIFAKEKATWETIKNKDYAAFGNMLASDYIEVEDDGVYDKAGIIAFVKDLNITETTFSDWKMLPIDNDAVILTYTTNLKATFKGEAMPTGPYRSAAAYVNRGGKWQSIYYQQTLAKPASSPAPSLASPSRSAKAAASPAAKAPEAGSDPIANERMVWDALKSKNYDAFGAFLAPDSVEVEVDGVYDKAGSVKSVRTVDLSKASLSDWKSVKLDDDASLVTYMVKLPGMDPDQERHTTIWVSRGGKWMALFHQGTPVAKPALKTATKKM
jgi:hypothetical protein